MTIEHNAFGTELRRRRIAAGLSLGELARKVHCSRSFLSRVETGLRRASVELAQLCDQVLDAKGALTGLAPPSLDSLPKAVRSGPGRRAAGPAGGSERRSAEAQRRHEFDRLLRRGDLSHTTGDMREADRHYRAAHRSAEGDPRARAEAVIRMARRWSDPGQVDHALLHLIRDSLAALQGDGGAEAAGLRLRLTAHLAKKVSMAVSEDTAAGRTGPEEGARLADDALSRLPKDGRDDEVRCEVLTECRWARYDFTPAADALSLSQQLHDAAVRHDSAYFRGEALMALVIDQLRTGRVYSAMATASQYRKYAADTRSALAIWQRHTLDALLDLWHGRFEGAADWILGESPKYIERLRADLAVPADNLRQTRLGQAFWLLREQGRMAELFASDLAEDVERHGYFPIWRAGLALALCETGQHAEGADLLVGFAADTAAFSRFPPSGWAVPTLVVLAEVCAALDVQGGYEAQLREVLPGLRERLAPHDGQQIALAGWPTVLVGSTARACGLLALAAGEPETALAHFRQAAVPARSSQPELARLRLARARALRGVAGPGNAALAQRLLEEALRSAEAYGMSGLAAQCRPLLETTDRT
ncbi:helix-turn-helix transcriptional regulator [Streptomyces sp. NBC_00878]|uniref:helix-turn-helix domain-containing protein n=1 Tax=Streptomyces sp. NBC_00878 TaxID=2975854 RepID=UPI00225903A2|nr:helix-turn-helix transcriptional regulator [Streptomyces sp. NBC_00878]MCX4905711.1 helix-turn-helix domain-containing protein [Streptomyces sp. NBC_00878]